MDARFSSAPAAAEFHSLSPPCVHSAETPGPLMPQPGAFSRGRFNQEGLSCGSPRRPVEKPRMFSASYQRYSCEVLVWETAVDAKSTKAIHRFRRASLCNPWMALSKRLKTL